MTTLQRHAQTLLEKKKGLVSSSDCANVVLNMTSFIENIRGGISATLSTDGLNVKGCPALTNSIT